MVVARILSRVFLSLFVRLLKCFVFIMAFIHFATCLMAWVTLAMVVAEIFSQASFCLFVLIYTLNTLIPV